jgi:hypothetical protein
MRAGVGGVVRGRSLERGMGISLWVETTGGGAMGRTLPEEGVTKIAANIRGTALSYV